MSEQKERSAFQSFLAAFDMKHASQNAQPSVGLICKDGVNVKDPVSGATASTTASPDIPGANECGSTLVPTSLMKRAVKRRHSLDVHPHTSASHQYERKTASVGPVVAVDIAKVRKLFCHDTSSLKGQTRGTKMNSFASFIKKTINKVDADIESTDTENAVALEDKNELANDEASVDPAHRINGSIVSNVDDSGDTNKHVNTVNDDFGKPMQTDLNNVKSTESTSHKTKNDMGTNNEVKEHTSTISTNMKESAKSIDTDLEITRSEGAEQTVAISSDTNTTTSTDHSADNTTDNINNQSDEPTDKLSTASDNAQTGGSSPNTPTDKNNTEGNKPRDKLVTVSVSPSMAERVPSVTSICSGSSSSLAPDESDSLTKPKEKTQPKRKPSFKATEAENNTKDNDSVSIKDTWDIFDNIGRIKSEPIDTGYENHDNYVKQLIHSKSNSTSSSPIILNTPQAPTQVVQGHPSVLNIPQSHHRPLASKQRPQCPPRPRLSNTRQPGNSLLQSNFMQTRYSGPQRFHMSRFPVMKNVNPTQRPVIVNRALYTQNVPPRPPSNAQPHSRILFPFEKSCFMNNKDIYEFMKELGMSESFSECVYNKPPEKYNIMMPPGGYKCQGCQDIFVFQSSLFQHIQRKSLQISFNCPHCPPQAKTGKTKAFVFYNKCMFLAHLKSHFNGTIPMTLMAVSHHQCKEVLRNAIINPLSKQLLPKSQQTLDEIAAHNAVKPKLIEDKTDSSPEQAEKGATDKVKNIQKLPMLEPRRTSTEIQIQTIEKEQVKEDSKDDDITVDDATDDKSEIKCGICKHPCNSSEELAKHMGSEISGKINFDLQCSTCARFMPTECALKAHKHFHKPLHDKILYCPECGISVPTHTMQNHATYSCFHYARRFQFICPFDDCKLKCFDIQPMKGHLLNKHAECYYKCTGCPMAFKTVASFTAHQQTHEDKEKAFLKYIFKCPFCDTVFHDQKQLFVHVLNVAHRKQVFLITSIMFRCPDCTKWFPQKQDLRDHYQTTHKGGGAQYICDCKTRFTTESAMIAHKLKCTFIPLSKKDPKNLNTDICPFCEEIIDLTKITLKEHATEKHPTISCIVCSSDFYSTKNFYYHVIGHQQEAKYVCLSCNKNIFKTQEGLATHVATCSKINNFLKMATMLRPNKVPKNLRMAEKAKSKLTFVNTETSPKSQPIFPQPSPSKEPVKEDDKDGESRSPIKIVLKVPLPRPPKHKCEECDTPFKRKRDLQRHMKREHGIVQQFSCHLCGMVYEKEYSLQRHIQVVHEGRKNFYACWVCREKLGKNSSFETRALLEKHLVKDHKLHQSQIDWSRIPEDAKDGDTSLNTEEDKGEKRKVDDTEDNHPDKSESPSKEEPSVKRLRTISDTRYSCCKCDFTADSKVSFHEHIPKHKTEDESIQCLECGMCFVIEPSLKRHLFIVHKVRDFQGYYKESGMNLDEEKEIVANGDIYNDIYKTMNAPVVKKRKQEKTDKTETEQKDPNILECTVCYREYETETALKNHMRSHGMAFIRSKRSIASDINKKEKEEENKRQLEAKEAAMLAAIDLVVGNGKTPTEMAPKIPKTDSPPLTEITPIPSTSTDCLVSSKESATTVVASPTISEKSPIISEETPTIS
ncbi:unnamed protein product [Owenia fusiformis]|uniref:Uncharacterized protein n=1 Tax=Owenia fusiformis TaxID=6347 RepID=A0A8J1TYZ9_OWEFU|nr:unnamed protein product [Owenia fusiformis]